MEEVCWSIFGTVCCAVVVGALTRGLEGFDTSNTQPFNIVSDLLSVGLVINIARTVWLCDATAYLFDARDSLDERNAF